MGHLTVYNKHVKHTISGQVTRSSGCSFGETSLLMKLENVPKCMLIAKSFINLFFRMRISTDLHHVLIVLHFHSLLFVSSASPSVSLAAILDDQSVCGRGERLALALARENINSVMEGPARARVEVDIYELQKDSQYDTTDTSE